MRYALSVQQKGSIMSKHNNANLPDFALRSDGDLFYGNNIPGNHFYWEDNSSVGVGLSARQDNGITAIPAAGTDADGTIHFNVADNSNGAFAYAALTSAQGWTGQPPINEKVDVFLLVDTDPTQNVNYEILELAKTDGSRVSGSHWIDGSSTYVWKDASGHTVISDDGHNSKLSATENVKSIEYFTGNEVQTGEHYDIMIVSVDKFFNVDQGDYNHATGNLVGVPALSSVHFQYDVV